MGSALAAPHHLPRCAPASSADDGGPLPVLRAAPRVPEGRRVASGGALRAGPSVARAAAPSRGAGGSRLQTGWWSVGRRPVFQADPGWPAAGHCIQAPVPLPWPFVTVTVTVACRCFAEVPAQQESRHGCCVIQSHACHPSGPCLAVTRSLSTWRLWAPSTLRPMSRPAHNAS